MQDACGGCGAIAALAVAMRSHGRALAAQMHACKAIAYLAKEHEANRARAFG
jgi:hypothetical protein